MTSLVFFQQTLYLGLRISACPRKIFRSIFKFILIEFELAFGNCNLILEIVFL